LSYIAFGVQRIIVDTRINGTEVASLYFIKKTRLNKDLFVLS